MNHRVLVTGAAGDPASTQPMSIGAATAIALAPCAETLWLLDRNRAGMEWTLQRLPAGSNAVLIECDLRDRAATIRALQPLADAGIDLVASVAGATRVLPFLDLGLDAIDEEIALNLQSHLWLAHALLPSMVARGSGSLVFVGSDSARVGAANLVPYTTAKGGLMSMVRSLAREMGPHGVRVNCVSPGPTRTPSRARLAGDDVPTNFAALPPLGRLGEPEDVARLIAFLLSTDGAYVTGQVVSVNGGLVTC